MNSVTNKPKRGRPAKNRQLNDNTKAALIRSGIETMTTHGYISSNLEEILKKVGVPKGSFYYYFKSKEDFGRAVIDSYDQFFAYMLDKHLNKETASPLSRLTSFYQDAKMGMEKYQFDRGCLIGGLSQEESLLPEGYNQRLNDILNDWQRKVAHCLKQAQEAGELSQQANCHELALFFWIGWEGAVLRAKLIKSAQPLDVFMNQFVSSLPQ